VKGLRCSFLNVGTSLSSNPPLFLHFQLIVEQEESFLVGLGCTYDGEHPLTSLVVRGLSDADFGPGEAADFSDLGATAADDAAHHVRRNRDVLGSEVSRRRSRRAESVGTGG
jgi:hypothetical protein